MVELNTQRSGSYFDVNRVTVFRFNQFISIRGAYLSLLSSMWVVLAGFNTSLSRSIATGPGPQGHAAQELRRRCGVVAVEDLRSTHITHAM
jgi:hypothetical protein